MDQMNQDRLVQPQQGSEARWVTQFRALMDPTPFHVQYGTLEKPVKNGEFYAYIAQQIMHDEAVISYQHDLRRKIEKDPKRYARRLTRFLDSDRLPLKQVKQQPGFYASEISVMHALENAGQPYVDERRKQLEAQADDGAEAAE